MSDLDLIVRPISSKGLGLFTKKRIPAGRRILAEKPAIFLIHQDVNAQSLIAAFQALSQEQQNQIRELSYTTVVGETPIMTSFRTNSYHCNTGQVLCIDAARINHSCTPNASANMNWKTGMFTVSIVHDVKPGDEITIAYCDLIQTSDLRARELQKWSFTCNCFVCERHVVFPQSMKKSNAHRERAHEILQLVTKFDHTEPAADEEYHFSLIAEFISLINAENIYQDLTTACSLAAECCLRTDERHNAQEWKLREQEYIRVTKGLDTIDGVLIDTWLRENEFRSGWGGWDQPNVFGRKNKFLHFPRASIQVGLVDEPNAGKKEKKKYGSKKVFRQLGEKEPPRFSQAEFSKNL